MRRLPAMFALSALLAGASGAAAGAPAAAGERALLRLPPAVARLAPAANGCAGGLVYDDGTFEDRYNFPGGPFVDVLQRFELPAVPSEVERICVCFTRTGGEETIDFDLLIYAADGLGGEPGSLLTGVGGLRAEGVPLFPQVAFYNLDVAALGLALQVPRAFIGPSWNSSAHPDAYLCGDESAPVPRPVFYSTDQGESWADLSGVYPALATVGVRAEVAGEGFACTPDARTLCLRDGRFQVRLSWRDRDGQLLEARAAAPRADDSGLFYFRNPQNWEMLVKVLDGCSLTGHYWVFAAAVTNVEYTLTVTDSVSGLSQEYDNPAGVSAPAVTDTEALPVCP